MRAIPNMTVLVPVDGNETRKMTRAIAQYKGPVYMRITRNDLPDVLPNDLPFEIGKPFQIRDGKDAVVFAHGLMVSKALEAAAILASRGISLRVVNVSSLKPVDEDALKSMAEGMKGIITVEEHSLIGGLGSLIADVFRGTGIPIQCIGIEDCFGQSAHNYEELLEAYGLTVEHIAATALELLR
jgi:transketolase